VLARQRAHVAQLAARLRDAGIRFQALELETLDSRPIVRDLFALTRALLHEGDRGAWLAVLRSPVCGMTLTDLEALVRGAPRRTVRELLADAEVSARLSAEGRARAARMRDLLEQALARSGRMSVRRNTEQLWLALGGPAATLGANALEDAAAFFDHLQLLEARGALPAGEAFNTEFAELYAEPDPEAPTQLQIMTIHKAKGLEFDIVLLPGLGRGRERSDPPLLHWLEVAQPEGPAGLLLAPITGKGAEADPHAAYVERRERECAALEKARLLYVAATRARRELHLFGHVSLKEVDGVLEMRAPEAGSHLELLWPAIGAEFEDALVAVAPGARVTAPMPARTTLRRHRADWRFPGVSGSANSRSPVAAVAPESARPTFDWASEVTRHVGSAVHAELDGWSRSGHLPDAEHVRLSRTRYSRLLAALGVPAEEREHAVSRVLEALTRTLADARGRWLFAPEHNAVRTELALSGEIDGSLVNAIIDRTFIDAEGVRWIVDFKTSLHEGGGLDAFLDNEVARYREQLARYATLVARLGPEPLRLGLYFPLLSGWREWAVQ
jgi:ATP-dependent exoDNAse (exonuclease V) beta subunit